MEYYIHPSFLFPDQHFVETVTTVLTNLGRRAEFSSTTLVKVFRKGTDRKLNAKRQINKVEA